MSDSVRLTVEGGVARLVLDRPARLNAIDFEAGEAFRDAALDATRSSSVRAIVLEGEGPAFCAGGDVLAMAGVRASGAEVTRMAETIHDGIGALVGSALPIVSAAQGAVAGGGIGVMLAADYVVAGRDLKVMAKYADVGLTPDLGVSTLLTEAVGRRRALQLLLSDTVLGADRALDWGMVAEIADDPRARARDVAAAWAAGPWRALGQAKRLVHAGATRPRSASFDDEAATIGAAFAGHEAQDRIAAFAEASRARTAGRER